MGLNTILIVDDEPKVRLLLRRCLESDGFTVVEASDEKGLLEALKSHDVQLLTLDIHLGDENGLEIAKRLRQHSTIPIIMVTGRDDVIDRIVGLEVGADDYITKPFHVREVLARVRTVLRRVVDDGAPKQEAQASPPQSLGSTNAVSFDGINAYLDRFELSDRNGERVELTTGDFRLLEVFLRNPKKILSRDQIMDHLNGQEWSPLDRTIDNQVARLRKEIERDPTSPVLIKTVRGMGYMFAADVTPISD